MRWKTHLGCGRHHSWVEGLGWRKRRKGTVHLHTLWLPDCGSSVSSCCKPCHDGHISFKLLLVRHCHSSEKTATHGSSYLQQQGL